MVNVAGSSGLTNNNSDGWVDPSRRPTLPPAQANGTGDDTAAASSDAPAAPPRLKPTRPSPTAMANATGSSSTAAGSAVALLDGERSQLFYSLCRLGRRPPRWRARPSLLRPLPARPSPSVTASLGISSASSAGCPRPSYHQQYYDQHSDWTASPSACLDPAAAALNERPVASPTIEN